MLTPEQAMYHFLSGYTARVAGTEIGVTEPVATFSTCFGAPFMPRHPSVYGNLLKARISKGSVDVWLVNTGWTGGVYGVGKRMPIGVTRALLTAALNGSLNDIEFRTDPFFGFEVPVAVPFVERGILDPRNTWSDKDAYDAGKSTCRNVRREFHSVRKPCRRPCPAGSTEGGMTRSNTMPPMREANEPASTPATGALVQQRSSTTTRRPATPVQIIGRFGAPRPLRAALLRGLRCRCPACGRGKLFKSFVKPVDKCSVCKEIYIAQRADDFPPYIVILLLGHIVVPLVIAVDHAFVPPLWFYITFGSAFISGLAIALLQPVKGAVIAYQWSYRMDGFGASVGTATRTTRP